MSRRTHKQMFALAGGCPDEVTVRGRIYRLVGVFKHDFFAATALYAADDGAAPERIVVKFGRRQGFCGLPLAWVGRYLARRERRIHRRIDGIEGIQRWVDYVGPSAFALEYLPGRPLDTVDPPPGGAFFDALRDLVDAVHERGVAYGDLNKRSNILVTPDGRPALIDFQICAFRPRRARWLRRIAADRIVAYLQRMDLYHLYKHKRRLAPEALRRDERAMAQRRGGLLRLHRTVATPVRQVRRRLLTNLHRNGRLTSPTACLEPGEQPEKATWRR
ncbi:MAG: hypothetical protein GX591_07140 [Planctomycetes bacterium]|nr:hypothetical protein [Planctomycetota bacterium]